MKKQIEGLILKAKRKLGKEHDPIFDITFFEKYPHLINIRYFLVNYDNLTDISAVTKYVNYMNALNSAGLEKNLPYIKDSIRFIKQFCKASKTEVRNYPFLQHNGVIDAFWIHLKDRKISKYVTVLFPAIVKKILTSDREETKYYLDDINQYNSVIEEMSSNEKTKNKLNEQLYGH